MKGFCGIFYPDHAHMPDQPHTVASELNAVLSGVEARVSGRVRQWQGAGVGMAQWGMQESRARDPADRHSGVSDEATSAGQRLWCSRDGRFWLLADARLDARAELVDALRSASRKGRGEDVEIAALLDQGPGRDDDEALLLAAYLAWGDDSPIHLTGDFAFSVWDQRRRQLFAARDPFGVKPLVYARWRGGFAVASRATDLLRLSAVRADLDEVSVALYLARHRTDEDRTFFRDVAALPPAHSLSLNLAASESTTEIRPYRYWMTSLPAPIRFRDARQYPRHFRQLWELAVRDRLRGTEGEDLAAVGLLLSGGLDSSSVALAASRQLPTGYLHAYRFQFPTLASCDESRPGDALAEALDLQVALLDAEQFDLLDGAFEPLAVHAESPFLGWEHATNRVLQGLQQQGVRILLTGHGGDNLLTGSALIYADRLISHPTSVWWQMRSHAHNHGLAFHELLRRCVLAPWLWAVPGYRCLRRRWTAEAAWPTWLSKDLARRTSLVERMRPSLWQPRLTGWARREICTHALNLGMTGQAVAWHGRGGDAFGVEVRHPFLDRRLAEFLLAIPPQQLFEAGRTKVLLRRALPELPDAVRQRRTKARFGAYLQQQLHERARDRVEALLGADNRSASAGFVDLPALRRAYAHPAASGTPTAAFWFPITLETWLRRQPNSDNNTHG